MAFYNSGLRRIDKEQRIARNKQVARLKSNEAADDTDRSSIDTTVTANTAAITTNTSTIAEQAASITTLEHDKLYTQGFERSFNDFFYAAAISTFQFPIEIPQNKMIQIVQFETIIYNPEAAGKHPTYNVANNAHLIQLTRNSTGVAANSTAFVNSSVGGPFARVCSVNAGLTPGPIYQTGTHADNEDHRRGVDHLNHRKLNDSAYLDTHLKICVMNDATSSANTTALGNQTKINIIVKYRLMSYPPLT